MKITKEEIFKEKNIFGAGIENKDFAKYFKGNSFLNSLTTIETSNLALTNVTFEPSCRNNWHIHNASKGGGQILICVAGEGLYQEEGKNIIELKPGMIITVLPGIKHWHGAKKDSWFSHIAIEIPGENISTEWCESVDDKYFESIQKNL